MTGHAKRQISFDLAPAPARMKRDDYLVSASNSNCLVEIDRWRLSNERLLAICGPRSSGKSHLACILADDLQAPVSIDARSAQRRIESGKVAIVDDAAALAPADLLALVDLASHGGGRLVIAGEGAPKSWALGLKDLETRLEAMPRLTTAQPDEALLQGLISKLLKDRQLKPSAPIAVYAAPRLPKTFAAAATFVAALDRCGFDDGAAVNLRLAREVLDNLSEAPDRHNSDYAK